MIISSQVDKKVIFLLLLLSVWQLICAGTPQSELRPAVPAVIPAPLPPCALVSVRGNSLRFFLFIKILMAD